jgi:hypothetical protein
MSLLAPVVSAGAIPPGSPAASSDMMPAFLAFASRMAAAGAPTLGPAPTDAQALTSAMSGGYGAARAAEALPYLQAAAGREAAGQELALRQQEFELAQQASVFKLQQTIMNRIGANLGAGTSTGGPAGVPVAAATPPPSRTSADGPGIEPPAPAAQLADLHDIKRLPAAIQPALVSTLAEYGAGPRAAALYARMLNIESGGAHFDPTTGTPLTSPKGAIGVGQVMPATFADQQAKYKFPGSIDDLGANLHAGVSYFMDGVRENNGDLNDAAIKYNGGPRALASYVNGGALPQETADYRVKVGAPAPASKFPGSVMIDGKPVGITLLAGSDDPAGAAAFGGANPSTGPMVTSALGTRVPQSVEQSAELALAGAGAGKGLEAYQKVIDQYVQARAQAGTVGPLTEDEKAYLDPRTREAQPLAVRNPDGTLKEIKLVAPRAIGIPFQQAKDMEDQVTNSNPYSMWLATGPRYDAVIGSANQGTRAGDEQMIVALAKMFDPNVQAPQYTLEQAKTYGGLSQQLRELVNRPMGESGFPPEVKQQIIDLATAEMRARDQSVLEQVERTRASAKAKGVDPLQVMPSLTTKAMTVDDAQAPYAPAGITFAKPLVTDPSGKFVRAPGAIARPASSTPPGSEESPTVGPQKPGAAAPASSSSGPAPTRNVLTPATVHDMSDSALRDLHGRMTSPQGRTQYTPQDAQTLLDEIRSRPTMMPK